MADIHQNLRQRHPNIPHVEGERNQNETNSRPNNLQGNEWTNYQRTGFWVPSYGPEEAGSYRDSPGKEYVQALRKWQCDYMNYLNYQRWSQMMMPYTMNMMQMQQLCMQQQIQQQNDVSTQRQQQQRPRAFQMFNPFGAAPQRPQAAQAQNGAVPQPRPNVQAPQPNAAINGHEFLVPPLWKRIAAEFIDFFFLFMIKLGITLLTVEYVGVLDLEKYDIEVLFSQDLDYEKAFAMTSELIVMEIINRVFICIFETLCLHKGVANQIGGATPGKRIMGLRVVSCIDVIETRENHARVAPARNIGFTNALVRSVIKNFSLAFFFPACFTVFFFQHNRAAYDVIANCMVVELTENDLRLGR